MARSSVGTKRAQIPEREPQHKNQLSTSQPPKLHDRIAIRAFEIFKERGGMDGQDLDDWFRAEQEVLNGRTNANPS